MERLITWAFAQPEFALLALLTSFLFAVSLCILAVRMDELRLTKSKEALSVRVKRQHRQ